MLIGHDWWPKRNSSAKVIRARAWFIFIQRLSVSFSSHPLSHHELPALLQCDLIMAAPRNLWTFNMTQFYRFLLLDWVLFRERSFHLANWCYPAKQESIFKHPQKWGRKSADDNNIHIDLKALNLSFMIPYWKWKLPSKFFRILMTANKINPNHRYAK